MRAVVPIEEACWRNEVEAFTLREFAHKIQRVLPTNRPGILVEVGSFLGESTRIFAESGFPVIAVDPWKNGYDITDDASETYPMEQVYAEFQRRARAFITAGLIVPLRGTSSEIATLFAPNSISVVYIDGEHTKEAVTRDLESWYPRVYSGGVISGHDWNYTEVQEAVLAFAFGLYGKGATPVRVDAYHNWYFVKP